MNKKIRNELIAETMKWTAFCGRILFDESVCKLSQPGNNTVYGIWLSKLLQARMVDDGWIVVISDSGIAINPDVKVRCSAIMSSICLYDVYAATEPAAIVELFCKVYGIGGDK